MVLRTAKVNKILRKRAELNMLEITETQEFQSFISHAIEKELEKRGTPIGDNEEVAVNVTALIRLVGSNTRGKVSDMEEGAKKVA